MINVADEQREQEIRERYPVAANPYGRMAIRDLLRLLDSERAKVTQLRLVALDVTPHLYEGGCPDRVEGTEPRDPDCPACAALGDDPAKV